MHAGDLIQGPRRWDGRGPHQHNPNRLDRALPCRRRDTPASGHSHEDALDRLLSARLGEPASTVVGRNQRVEAVLGGTQP